MFFHVCIYIYIHMCFIDIIISLGASIIIMRIDHLTSFIDCRAGWPRPQRSAGWIPKVVLLWRRGSVKKRRACRTGVMHMYNHGDNFHKLDIYIYKWIYPLLWWCIHFYLGFYCLWYPHRLWISVMWDRMYHADWASTKKGDQLGDSLFGGKCISMFAWSGGKSLCLMVKRMSWLNCRICVGYILYIYIYCHLNRLNHPLRLVRNSTVGWL